VHEKFLERLDVAAILQQVGRNIVTGHVGTGWARDVSRVAFWRIPEAWRPGLCRLGVTHRDIASIAKRR